jgi:threonine dehydrogenase-like Zn-dependent dehydrogenase
MKALVKKQATAGILLEDVPKPKQGPNDLVIVIAKTAICGTDMHIYQWDAWAQKTIPVPTPEPPGQVIRLPSTTQIRSATDTRLWNSCAGSPTVKCLVHNAAAPY